MAEKLKVVCLVPARTGSKGVPNKNWRPLAGVSLVERTLFQVIESQIADSIVLSTDAPEGVSLCQDMGVEFLERSQAACSDAASAYDVVLDFVERSAPINLQVDVLLVYLQPTSVFRTARHIREAVELAMTSDGRRVVSVRPSTESPYKAFRLDGAGTLTPVFNEVAGTTNRQALPKTFYPNGAIYIFRLRDLLDSGTFPIRGATAYHMDIDESLDIDSIGDWRLAERRLIHEG